MARGRERGGPAGGSGPGGDCFGLRKYRHLTLT